MVLVCAAAGLSIQLATMFEGPRHFTRTTGGGLFAASARRPAVVLLDAELPHRHRRGGRAAEMIPELLAASPWMAIVLVTTAPAPEEIAEATLLGAFGCVDRERFDFAACVAEAIALGRRYSRRQAASSVAATARRAAALH